MPSRRRCRPPSTHCTPRLPSSRADRCWQQAADGYIAIALGIYFIVSTESHVEHARCAPAVIIKPLSTYQGRRMLVSQRARAGQRGSNTSEHSAEVHEMSGAHIIDSASGVETSVHPRRRQAPSTLTTHRFQSWLRAIGLSTAFALTLTACTNIAPSPPPGAQVISEKGDPFTDLMVPKLEASTTDGAIGVEVDSPLRSARPRSAGRGEPDG